MANGFRHCCSPCQEQIDIATNFMQELEQMQHVDDLIVYIDELINEKGRGGQGQVRKSNSVDSSINSAGHLTVKLSKSPNWHVHKKCLLASLDSQTRKVVIEVLKQGKHTQCVGIALSIIVHLWERAEQASSNKDDCLDLLRYVSALAKHMKNSNIHLEGNKLNDVLCFILNATVTCVLLMQSNSLCRFISAPMDYADLQNLKSQLLCSYPDLQLHLLIEALNRIPTVVGPSKGEYPQHAVGIEGAKNKVIDQLNLEHSSRRAVVIYGLGGIGKSTLATAVFSSLDLSRYRYCRVVMDNSFDESNLLRKQSQILHHLFKKHMKLHDWTEGQEKLLEAFREATEPVFLFIENALRQTDLEMLLPVEHLSGLHMLSRILVTTRNLNEIDIFGRHEDIQVYSHRVDSLSEPEATRLLCHYALGDANRSFDPTVNMNGLLQICEGIPLVLKTVGDDLCRFGNTESACKEIIKYHNEWQQKGFQGKEDGSEPMVKRMVDFVYRQLREPSQQAFLDIAAFFYDWERSKVRDIVGEMQLEDIRGAALVTTSEEDKVKMHEIVKARGRRLSEGNRITDWESWDDLIKNEQALQNIKGIWLHYDDRHISVEAKNVDLMSRSLRVLSFGKRTRLNGQCEGAFEELRFLEINYEDMLSIKLRKSRQLRLLIVHLMKEHRICEADFTNNLPESSSLVLYLEVDASDSPALFHINGDFQHYIGELKKRLSDLNITATQIER